MADQLYTIHCMQGAPLSSWSEAATETEILDRYYEQFIDQADDEADRNLKRSEFTRDLFESIWECALIEA